MTELDGYDLREAYRWWVIRERLKQFFNSLLLAYLKAVYGDVEEIIVRFVVKELATREDGPVVGSIGVIGTQEWFNEFVEPKKREQERATYGRLTLKPGQPCIKCPIHGTVAVEEKNIDPTFAIWTIACPLCGEEVEVGKFGVVMALACFKRQRLNPPSDRIIP